MAEWSGMSLESRETGRVIGVSSAAGGARGDHSS